MINQVLLSQTGRGPVAAGNDSRQLLRYLAEDAGIFSVTDGAIAWSHQNFRDYFAARHVVSSTEGAGGSEDLVQLIQDSWIDAGQETFARFVVCMASDSPNVVEYISRQMITGSSFVMFIARAIADGANFVPEVVDQHSNRLFTLASAAFGTCANVYASTAEDPVANLKLIAWKQPYLALVVSFIARELEAEVLRPDEFRMELAKILYRTIGKDKLSILLDSKSASQEILDLLQSSTATQA